MRAFARPLRILLTAVAGLFAGPAGATDVTWSNGSGDGLWNSSSVNWSGATWNNAAGDGAIFGTAGAGAVSVPGAVTVRSMSFTAGGYTLSGAGPITLTSSGTSTLAAGVVSVDTGVTARLDAAIVSTVGLQKLGAGVLELGGTNTITGAIPITASGSLTADVMIGANPTGTANAGTLRLLTATALATTTTVGIGNGYLDIGANNVTIANLRFTNQNSNSTWNTTLNANNGVVGSGTLRVTGEITVNGINLSPGGNNGNAIAANLNLGGGTQVIRVGRGGSIGLANALQITGSVSNGSLLKTIGPLFTGSTGGIDGLSLYGNNTYAGSTLLNGSSNLATGTNASTLVRLVGAQFSLQGANGSFLSAPTIQAYSVSTLILDNAVAVGAAGTFTPNVPAAQNNDRIRDDAAVELRDSAFTYRGLASATATETYGSLTASGGHNTITVTPGASGTATLTAAGALTLGDRATMTVQVSGTGVTLGGAAKVIFGSVPAADATGILRRMVAGTDLVTYNAANGLTPFAGYATDITTAAAGSNVSQATAATAPSVALNSLRLAATAATTFTVGSGNTLGLASGMLVNGSTTGTQTVTGGTIAFGDAPGAIFGGGTTLVVASALTGTQGAIVANGSVTLSGDLSGLAGPLTVNSTGTTTLGTGTFAGPIQVRVGTLNLGASLAAGGAITLGVPQNDANLFATVPTLSLQAAGANSTFARDIVSDNGATNAAGFTLINSLIPLLQPLSNGTGSQTISGNVTLTTSLNLQGGGGTGTIQGSTNFTGTVSGPGTFYVPNGRFAFQAGSTVSNAGGFVLGGSGFTMIGTFAGTATGTGPVVINGGSNSTSGVSYAAGGLPGGDVTVQNASGSTSPTIIPLATGTLPNRVNLNGDAIVNVGTGITATWSGQLTGNGTLTKSTGPGTLVLSNATNTHTGPVAVNAGTLTVNGTLASSSNIVTVGAAGVLSGTGTVNRQVIVSGTLATGTGPGVLTIGGELSLAANSTLAVKLNGTAVGTGYDRVVQSGANRIRTINAAANLVPITTSTTLVPTDRLFILTFDAPASATATGTFANLPQNGGLVVSGVGGGTTYTAEISYVGDAATNALTGGRDVVLYNFTPIPEPAGLLAVAAAAGAVLARRRRK